MSELKSRLQADMKSALKAGDKPRLGTIRLALAAIKQREVDDRVELDDTQVLGVLDKMVKQRRDSHAQYTDAGREDLAAQEAYEIEVLTEYLPAQLDAGEVEAMVDAVIAETGAESMKDMGRVMGALNPKLKGRADMKQVSGLVRARLG
ncbi:MAG: GatB/YqeY domain-containing protein [Xanthomonadales bacterium]|nr:GatB/YqeY domain-containing protein [Xanthomonadales bacterium]